MEFSLDKIALFKKKIKNFLKEFFGGKYIKNMKSDINNTEDKLTQNAGKTSFSSIGDSVP